MKRNKVSGWIIDIKREDAFLQAVNYLQEKVQFKIEKCQLCKTPFSFKHMKKRLLNHYSERAIITEVKGKPNKITLRSTASYILKDFYS